MAAAMRAKLATLITAVESPEQWDEIVSGLGKKLLVVDLHKKWCGPCEVMRPIFERIFLNTDECENRCSFVSVSDEVSIKALEAYTAKVTSKPFFLLWKQNEIVGKVDGCNSPEVSGLINEHMPSALDDDM
jgi:thiol-disulfide isomerase/thioredoxin